MERMNSNGGSESLVDDLVWQIPRQAAPASCERITGANGLLYEYTDIVQSTLRARPPPAEPYLQSFRDVSR